mmetsp:Transcript_53296/g.59607  ORF Transcript_53296/g.59607 Transcript_53296/m.59607 type:complete len:260 (-) Transcript_53296:210-989(-)
MVLINFFAKLSSMSALRVNGTDEYALNEIAGHMFLLTLSVINVVYLFFIEGLAKRALQKNFLQQLTFFGSLMQIGTCTSTIIRFNIQDAHNPIYGIPSTVFAFIANSFNFIALGVTLFHSCDNRKMKWRIFSVSIIGLATVGAYLQITTSVIYLNGFLITSPPFCIICHLYTSHALQKGTVTIDSAIISKEATIRTFKVMAYFLSIVYVLGNLILGMNVVALINQGLTFCCINIGTYYMDQMVGLYDKPVRRETESLLP